MTRDEISSQVSRQLDDLGAAFFETAKDINPSIQDGYNLLAALCETVETSATVNFVDDLVYYNFRNYIPNYLRIFGIYNNNIGRWMNPVGHLDMLKYRYDWELMNGEPRFFIPIDWRTVAITPVQSVARGSMTVLYKATAPILTGSDSPILPPEQHQVLRNYVLDDLLDQCQEWTKALDYFQMWNTGIEDIRRVLRNRNLPNQIYHQVDFRMATGF